jgi:hypothetical protein
MKRLKIFLATLVSLGLLIAPLPAAAFDLFPSSVCNASTTDSSVCKDANGQGQVNPVIHIIQIAASGFALIGGMLAVIMVIVAGFQMVTSAGNAEAITNARKKIVSALVGIALIALSWTIIRLVTDQIIK